MMRSRQRPGDAHVPELAASGDELLDDERRAGGPLGDEDDDRGRGALALDALDERGDLARATAGRGPRATGAPQAGLDDREVLAQRVLARRRSGWSGEHEREPLVAGDPGHERREGPGRGVGDVEVLEREDDRPLGGEAAQPAEQRLERARLAALGIRERAPHGCPGRPAARRGQAGQLDERARRRRDAGGVSSSSSGRVARSGARASSTAAHGGSTGP